MGAVSFKKIVKLLLEYNLKGDGKTFMGTLPVQGTKIILSCDLKHCGRIRDFSFPILDSKETEDILIPSYHRLKTKSKRCQEIIKDDHGSVLYVNEDRTIPITHNLQTTNAAKEVAKKKARKMGFTIENRDDFNRRLGKTIITNCRVPKGTDEEEKMKVPKEEDIYMWVDSEGNPVPPPRRNSDGNPIFANNEEYNNGEEEEEEEGMNPIARDSLRIAFNGLYDGLESCLKDAEFFYLPSSPSL